MWVSVTCDMLLIEHKQMRSTRALSYPKANNPPTDAYHKHPQSDVKRKLVYGDVSNASITEESPEKSFQVL